jgi:hypothetical protein
MLEHLAANLPFLRFFATLIDHEEALRGLQVLLRGTHAPEGEKQYVPGGHTAV